MEFLHSILPKSCHSLNLPKERGNSFRLFYLLSSCAVFSENGIKLFIIIAL